jgi:hypothetical protein
MEALEYFKVPFIFSNVNGSSLTLSGQLSNDNTAFGTETHKRFLSSQSSEYENHSAL